MTDAGITTSTPSPFTSIWTRPRETVRHLVQTDPTRHVVQLAMAGGVAQSISQAMDAGVGDTLELPAILALTFLLGSLFGLAAVYVGSVLIEWTGRWLGGQGSRLQLRTAIAWSHVPWAAFLFIAGLVFALIGKLPFVSEEVMATLPVGAGDAVVLGIFAIVMIVVAIWSFVILLKGVAEVQGFSAWKAWGNLLLCLLPLVGVGILAAILVSLLGA